MLEKLGSKFIRSLGRFLACNQKRSSIYIYILIYFYIAVFRDTDFIGPHFVRHSIRETFSSPTFAVLFPFFSHLPRLHSSPPPSISSRFSRFFNVVALSPSCFSSAAISMPPASTPREKRRNESGTPLELLMLAGFLPPC